MLVWENTAIIIIIVIMMMTIMIFQFDWSPKGVLRVIKQLNGHWFLGIVWGKVEKQTSNTKDCTEEFIFWTCVPKLFSPAHQPLGQPASSWLVVGCVVQQSQTNKKKKRFCLTLRSLDHASSPWLVRLVVGSVVRQKYCLVYLATQNKKLNI